MIGRKGGTATSGVASSHRPASRTTTCSRRGVHLWLV